LQRTKEVIHWITHFVLSPTKFYPVVTLLRREAVCLGSKKVYYWGVCSKK
jgi:hypothetical protein